ncbi:hypothetical protein GVAMD_0667 [Gardnerella vaginalis AMD]|nr:hypothetical protein GVAMD_0667 [Gardnerella vaginalis AMD]
MTPKSMLEKHWPYIRLTHHLSPENAITEYRALIIQNV